jgi:hypothetical protein
LGVPNDRYQYAEWDFSAPPGDSNCIANVVARNNRCGVTTYLVEARCLIINGEKKGIKYFLDEGPYSLIGDMIFPKNEANPTEKLPTRESRKDAKDAKM